MHVFVNGVRVLKDGEHTGATPRPGGAGFGLDGPGRNGEAERMKTTRRRFLQTVGAGAVGARLAPGLLLGQAPAVATGKDYDVAVVGAGSAPGSPSSSSSPVGGCS